MADEADIAQDALDTFMADGLQAAKAARERELKNLPRCENFDDCGNKVVVLPNKVICRFCGPCLEEFKAAKA